MKEKVVTQANHSRNLRIINYMIREMNKSAVHLPQESKFHHMRGARFMIRTAAKAMGFNPRQLAALDRKF